MTTALTAAVSLILGQSHSIYDYVQPNLKDVSFTAKVGDANQKELAKINEDFAKSYRIKSTLVRLKEPMKLRVESELDPDNKIVMVLNGATQSYRYPRAGLGGKQNLSRSPGKRQTFLDFGLLTPGLFKDFYVPHFVRMDRDSGLAVFDLTFPKALDDTSRQRVFIDPSKHYIVKREWYAQEGNLRAVFHYDKPVQSGGVWIPTKTTVYNAERKVAGVTNYSGVRANSGLSEDLFRIG
ncbi:MAG: outer membrane lipoprotein-sorting protein [Fimbriimonadaceae bacterium]|nr:outer membrane lipoprotein-sorting protein [Fimbriimonadaceae bacterium]